MNCVVVYDGKLFNLDVVSNMFKYVGNCDNETLKSVLSIALCISLSFSSLCAFLINSVSLIYNENSIAGYILILQRAYIKFNNRLQCRNVFQKCLK
jgi:hypothetical protein